MIRYFTGPDTFDPSAHDATLLVDYSRYRRYPGFNAQDCLNIFKGSLVELAKTAWGVAARAQQGALQFLAMVVPLPWDSQHFGMPMARLHVWTASPTVGPEELEAVSGLLSRVQDEYGCRHVSMDVDIDNFPVMNAVLGLGFEVMDFKRSYFTNVHNRHAENDKGLSRVRPYVPADYTTVMALLDEVQFETRYTRDCRLDRQRAQAAYHVWMDGMLRNEAGKNLLLVSERSDGVVACGAMGEVDFSKYGIDRKVRTNSLFACSKMGVGDYGAILTRLTQESLKTHDLIDGAMSLNNASAIRVVEGVRPNRSVTLMCLRRYAP